MAPGFFLAVKSPDGCYDRLRTAIAKHKNNPINIARAILVDEGLRLFHVELCT